MTVSTKSFPLSVVLTGTTGILLCPSFSDFHELADVLYPGIMTLGLARAADRIRQRILEQHPGLPVSVPDVGKGKSYLDAIRPWLDEQAAKFGAELTITHDPARSGPDDLGDA